MTKVVFLFLGFSFGISKASAIDLRDYLTENDIKSIGAIIANNIFSTNTIDTILIASEINDNWVLKGRFIDEKGSSFRLELDGQNCKLIDVRKVDSLGNTSMVNLDSLICISSPEIAHSIAELICVSIFGNTIFEQKPYTAKLTNNVWIVEGSLNKDELGGAFYIELEKNTSEVLKIKHGK